MRPRELTLELHVDALARRHQLAEALKQRLLTLAQLVAEDALAPTTVRDPSKVVDDHLADSLAALGLAEVTNAATIADLGAGAGFPGLPLAIVLPAAQVVLVESNARKARFIARAAAACGLENARVVTSRAESWPEGIGAFDLVTARAVAPLDVVAEYAAPLLRIGGTLVAWRGRRDPEAEAAAGRAAATLGLALHEPVAVWPYPGAQHRHLHLISKVTETPATFPRRPGLAVKRPLGAGKGPSDRRRR